MSNETFRGLAKDALPIIGDLEKLLEKHGVEGSVGLMVSADGYFNFR